MVKKTRTRNDYQDEAFQLLLARFDRVDKDNQAIIKKFDDHLEKGFGPLKAQVGTHSTYWGLLIGLGGPTVLGIVAWFNGLFK